jgi:hypothetical protein
MNKYFKIIFFALFFAGNLCQAQTYNKKLTEFVFDLTSSNIKLRGQLMQIGEFKGDLSNLTYEKYLTLLKASEKSSNRGITEIIRSADKYLFATKKNSFLIALYSKELSVVLYDDANTSKTDSVKPLFKDEKIPDLKEFVRKSGFTTN